MNEIRRGMKNEAAGRLLALIGNDCEDCVFMLLVTNSQQVISGRKVERQSRRKPDRMLDANLKRAELAYSE